MMADPRTLPASYIQSQAIDPARRTMGPPNFGDSTVPHIFTIAARYGVSARAYQWADEAVRHNRQNAEAMRKETAIMECLEGRQRATALLKWHIQPEEEKNSRQKQLAEVMTDILQRTPRFVELRRVLQEALWYGRYMTVHQFEATMLKGRWRTRIGHWEPRNGDKLAFRFDDGTPQTNPRQVGIRVGSGVPMQADTTQPFGIYRRKIEATQYGLVYWLDDWQRKLCAVHKHMVEDCPFEDFQRSGSIHGVGIRDRIYWTWYGMQECLAHMLEYLERTALGIEIWHYPANNPTAEEKTRKAAETRIGGGRSIVLVPVYPGEDADMFGVQHIEPGLGGIDALKDVIQNFFGGKIKRYILGQTLTTEAEATGLGSGVADAHLATFADIITYDAINQSETITEDILRPLQLWNFPDTEDVYLRFVLDTESDDSSQKMAAYQQAWAMGLKLRADDIRSIIGSSKPGDDEEAIENPQASGGGGPMGQPGIESLFSGGPAKETSEDDQEDSEPMRREEAGQDGEQERYSAVTAEEVDRAASQTVFPSEKQRKSGNYRKGSVRIHGLEVRIETPKGRRRRPEWPPMPAHYGYIRGTEGKDGDHVDVFVGPNPESEFVVVIDQVRPSGRFDEHKVVLGTSSEKEARELYLSAYQPGWKCGPITTMTIGQFRKWLDLGDTTQRIFSQVSRYRQTFDEAKHHRDEDGKFAPKGTFAKPKAERSQMREASKVGSGKSAKIVMADGTDAPPHIQEIAGKIPPAWENVRVSTDPNSDVLVSATMVNRKTGKQESKTVYGASYEMKTAAIKFARVREGVRMKGVMYREIHAARKDPATRDVADLAMMIMEQATRPGSEADTKGMARLYGETIDAKNVKIEATPPTKKGQSRPPKVSLLIRDKEIPIRDKKAAAELQRRIESGESLEDSTYWLKSYGATTLEARHVVIDGDQVRLEFMGKESVWHSHVVSDPEVARMLVERKKAATKGDQQLFPVSETALNKFIAKLDGEHFTAKDFRTMKATEIAMGEIDRMDPPSNETEYGDAVMRVAAIASRKLGNEPAQALASYIDPTVFHAWRSAAGV